MQGWSIHGGFAGTGNIVTDGDPSAGGHIRFRTGIDMSGFSGDTIIRDGRLSLAPVGAILGPVLSAG